MCNTAYFFALSRHTDKLPHLEPRIQSLQDSKSPGLKTEGFKHSRIQGFTHSGTQEFMDGRTQWYRFKCETLGNQSIHLKRRMAKTWNNTTREKTSDVFFSGSGVCKINVDLQNIQLHFHGPPLPITMLKREDLPRDLRRIHVYFAAPCTHSFQFYFQHCGWGMGVAP